MASGGDASNDALAALTAFDELFHDQSPSTVDELPVTLDRAALAISRVLQPRLDVDVALRQLDELADTCPAADRDAIAAHVLGSGRLVGDRTTYGHWHNSCIDRVVASGKGMPITLAVVTIEVARRVGVPLVGVGMPGHFLVGDATDGEWLIDPFDAGRSLSVDECRAIFASAGGGPQSWRPEFLQPTSSRVIIIRILNNLKAGFVERRDRLRLALVMRMRLAVPELTSEMPQAIRATAIFN